MKVVVNALVLVGLCAAPLAADGLDAALKAKAPAKATAVKAPAKLGSAGKAGGLTKAGKAAGQIQLNGLGEGAPSLEELIQSLEKMGLNCPNPSALNPGSQSSLGDNFQGLISEKMIVNGKEVKNNQQKFNSKPEFDAALKQLKANLPKDLPALPDLPDLQNLQNLQQK